MNSLFLTLLLCPTIVFADCTFESALEDMKLPTYNFSVYMLNEVSAQSYSHFVCSPLSTWLDIMSYSEKLNSTVAEEIWNLMGSKTECHRKLFINKIKELLEVELLKKKNNIVFFKSLETETSTIRQLIKDKNTDIVPLMFNNLAKESQDTINEVIKEKLSILVKDSNDSNLLYDLAFLVMTESSSFKGTWKTSSNEVTSKVEPFYSEEDEKIAEVEMTTLTGNYKVAVLPEINAKVINIPLNADGLTMIVLVPKESSINDLYKRLANVSVTAIFDALKSESEKLVSVKIPNIKLSSKIENIVEIVSNFGVSKMFYPDLKELTGKSKDKVMITVISQVKDIEISENDGDTVKNKSSPSHQGTADEFFANRPFGYLIVDESTETIVLAGAYSDPNLAD